MQFNISKLKYFINEISVRELKEYEREREWERVAQSAGYQNNAIVKSFFIVVYIEWLNIHVFLFFVVIVVWR